MAKQYGLVYIKRNKTKTDGKSTHWHDKKRAEAVATYLALGNMALVSRTINVPLPTLKNWVQQDWWKELVAETQNEQDLKLNKNLEKIVEKSLNAVNEILDNGDYMYDSKKGKVVRVPPKLRDVNKIAGDLIDRQMLIRKQHKPVSQSQESTEGRLLKLAESFAKLVHGKAPEEHVIKDVIEGEYENLPAHMQEQLKEKGNAVSTQWNSTVQARASLGEEEQAQQGEGQGSKECSEVEGG